MINRAITDWIYKYLQDNETPFILNTEYNEISFEIDNSHIEIYVEDEIIIDGRGRSIKRITISKLDPELFQKIEKAIRKYKNDNRRTR